MHTTGRMHMAGRRAGLVLGSVRVSSGELNVFLISRHVAICTSGRVMITNDTLYTAGHQSAILVRC